MCRLLCINDLNKPDEIPSKKWITKGHEYTCIWITIHPNQGNIQGVQLAEITLDETCASCTPFQYCQLVHLCSYSFF